MQTINTNQEIKAYNNNLKYSVNALINSNKSSQSQSDKNNFVNNFKNSNNNNTSAKMSEIIRPILTQRNPSYSAKVAGSNHKLANSKTSVSLIRNESFKKPSQNNLENSFNSFSSSSMKIIPNPIHLSCQKNSRILSNNQPETKTGLIVSKSNDSTNSTSLSNNTQPSHRHQKIVVQASTSDLLRCFASFLSQRCSQLFKEVNKTRQRFDPRETISWLRMADRALLLQGWQDVAFLNPVNVIFFYMMVRDSLKPIELRTIYDLQCNIMACLYLAFSYMGNEISYPLKPFLVEVNRDLFWQRTIMLMSKLSGNMLRINQDPKFFTELFYELKSYSVHANNQYSVASNPKVDMSLSLNHPPPQTTTFKSLHNTKNFNSTSTISLSELNAINNINNSKLDKLKENQNINNTIDSKNYHTLMKPISSSQLLLNKTNKINENSSHFFASLQKPEALYETKVDLPKIESVSVAKIKPECFNFLNKNDQFVMYGATNEEQSLTYCI
jgi:cyclin-dependent kinase 5 activator 1